MIRIFPVFDLLADCLVESTFIFLFVVTIFEEFLTIFFDDFFFRFINLLSLSSLDECDRSESDDEPDEDDPDADDDDPSSDNTNFDDCKIDAFGL